MKSPPAIVLLFVGVACAHSYLKGRIEEWHPRFPTLKETLQLLDRTSARVLVETGTSRYGHQSCLEDGCSTMVFGEWAFKNKAELYSVDADELACRESHKHSVSINPSIKFYVQDSVSFLRLFDRQIDLLYLNHMDYKENDHVPSQVQTYNEIKEAYSKLHRKTIILLDDCQLPRGGRCRLAVEFLEQREWKVWISGYQTLLLYHGVQLPERLHASKAGEYAATGKTLVDTSHLKLEYLRTCPLPYYWIKARRGDIFQHSVSADPEQEQKDGLVSGSCYVGRTRHFGEPVHGCIYPMRGIMSYPHGNLEHTTEFYEVLVRHPAYTYMWTSGHDGIVPEDAVYSLGQYVGRAKLNEVWLAAKVQPQYRSAYVAHGGKEHRFTHYGALLLQLKPEFLT